MKILIASVNHEHPNTMHINYYNSLAEVAEVYYFGPGFSTKEELRRGISRYVDINGPFDAVICTFPLLMSSLEVSTVWEVYKWNRYFLSDYSVGEAIRYSCKIADEIRSMDIAKFVLFSQDTINISERWYYCLKELLEFGFYIISAAPEPNEYVEEEKTFGEGLSVNNRFWKLKEQYGERFITIPVTAAICSEFFFAPLEQREYDWVIPGNIDGCYYKRGEILRQLEKAGYKIYDDFIDRTMAYRVDESRIKRCQYRRKADKMVDEYLGKNNPYLLNSFKREEIARWRENYNVSLRHSKAAYADGGEGRMIVRKYMEIPARGTLLMCENIPGLDKLGFRDGENMVMVTPENVLEISRELFKDLEKMQKIADNGRRLIISKHTSRNRAEGTVKAIEVILQGKYDGSYWENGEFKIREIK